MYKLMNFASRLLNYQELYLELKKLQKLVGDDCVDNNWLMGLLEDLVGATFAWISSKSEIWSISEEDLADHHADFMQVCFFYRPSI